MCIRDRLIVYVFSAKITSYEQIIHECQLSSESQLSKGTVADWLSFCREVCRETVARETPKLIGGLGLTVEVDESKFGKRKYNKGRLVEGQWVIGGEGICRETGDIFLAVCLENKRDASTLIDIIERHVNKDADGWRHLTVNHQYNFVGTTIVVRIGNKCSER